MTIPSVRAPLASNPTVPVDLGRFNRLTDGDLEFARDLATTFIASGNQQLIDISKALEASDRASVARAAHKLKGASANIYAQVLADLAARLETEAPTAEVADLAQVSEALRHEFDRTSGFLMDSIPSQVNTA